MARVAVRGGSMRVRPGARSWLEELLFVVLDVVALRDCQLISEFNVDFLAAAGATLKGTDMLLNPRTNDVHTLLSTILTNQPTYLDGLQATLVAWSERDGLTVPIVNDTNKLYNLSLLLFTRAWVPTAAKGSKKHGDGDSKKPHNGHGHGSGKKPPSAAAAANRRTLFDAAPWWRRPTTSMAGSGH